MSILFYLSGKIKMDKEVPFGVSGGSLPKGNMASGFAGALQACHHMTCL